MKQTCLLFFVALILIFPSGLLQAATYTVTNTNDSGAGSLRQAITDANNNAGLDTIEFGISGSGVHTVQPSSALPAITSPVVLDGWSQGGGGYTGPPLIEIDGTNTTSASGLTLSSISSGCTIRGLVINRFDNRGVIIRSENNTIHGCYIGTDNTGTSDLGNGSHGILISASNNQIGGISNSNGNLISGNDGHGIYLDADDIKIEGNLIGTDINGTSSLGNSFNGIALGGGSGNTIGGAGSGYRNIISGNSQDGIYINSSSDNTIQGCYIGTNINGTSALGNGGSGIHLNYLADNTTIGGTSSETRNIISGNNDYGIHIMDGSGISITGNYIGTDVNGASSIENDTGIMIYEDGITIGGNGSGEGNVISGNDISGIDIRGDSVTVLGNFIGTNASGTSALPNQNMGIDAHTGQNFTIGGTTTGDRNIISGNTFTGLHIRASASNGTIKGNFIGTDVNGTSTIANVYGILCYASNTTIGGTGTGEKNTIAYNGNDGIYVTNEATNNKISGNSIKQNGGLGIDLHFDGVSANDTNDPDTGANNLQNFPVITSAETTGVQVQIEGTLNSTSSTTFTLEFFANSALDPSGHGEGERYIGTDIVTTDGTGNVSFTTILNVAVPADQYITSTATDPDGNTSEFSAGILAPTLAMITNLHTYHEGGTVVQWETSSESGTAGFFLQRKNTETGFYTNVINDFIPGLLNAPQGGIYRVRDPYGTGQPATYRLVEVEAGGKKRIHGPFPTAIGKNPRNFNLGSFHGLYHRKSHPITEDKSQRLMEVQADKEDVPGIKRYGSPNALKLEISKKGLHRVTSRQIADGLEMTTAEINSAISNGEFRILNRKEEISWTAAPGNRGLCFYGEPLDTNYYNNNIYWLVNEPGTVMDEDAGGSSLPTGAFSVFRDKQKFEENIYAGSGLFSDPDSDYWLWDYVFAGNSSMDKKRFDLNIHGVAAGSHMAALTVRLFGATDTEANPDHHVRVEVNGANIGQGTWDGKNSKSFRFKFQQKHLNEGFNKVTVRGLLNTGAPYSIFYINSFELEYQRYFHAHRDHLIFNGEGKQNATISGFSSNNIMICDITDQENPRHISSATITRDGSGFQASFKFPNPNGRYVAQSINRLYGINTITAAELPGSGDKCKGAEYIIISPRKWVDECEELASYRNGQGLDSTVVSIEWVHDQFNDGIPHAKAIKSFLTSLWKQCYRKPKYVVLAGKGTLDFRNILKYRDNIISPMLAVTPEGMFVSDSLLGDVSGDDGVPEIAVGRLPVSSLGELRSMIRKIISHESSGGSGRVMLAADNADKGGDFCENSNQLMKLIPKAYGVNRIYLPLLNPRNARQKIIQGLNRGTDLFNFIGHAGMTSLAHEDIFDKTDLRLLNNKGKYPITIFLTCAVGNFAIPGYDCLSELLLLKNNAGAVAVWSPSGPSINSSAARLGTGFYKAAFNGAQNVRLGDGVLNAFENSRGAPVHIRQIYNILGDPATILK